MKKIIAVLLALCVVLSFGIPTFAAEPKANHKLKAYGDYITYNAPLTNTYKCLTEDKALNIVYFGGSVTVGIGAKNESGQNATETESWRALTTQWFKEKFASASINAYSAAIGGTGTFLGTIRLQSDVIAKKPDLVFIEFAINDTYCGHSKETAALQLETIVREIRNYNQKCDIVIVLTTDQSKAAQFPFPALYDTAAGHAQIANAYNLPIIDVGSSIVVEKLYGNPNSDEWNMYFRDVVHPLSKGYREYYNCIEEYLTNALLNTDFTGCEKAPHEMGKVVSAALQDGERKIFEGEAMTPLIEEAVGFSLNPNYAWPSNPKHTGMYRASEIGTSSLTFKFTGTELTLWTNLSSGSSLVYTLDGGEEKTYYFVDNGPKAMLKDLKSGEHTITIKPTELQAGVVEFQLYAICTRDATKATVKGTPFIHTHSSPDGEWVEGETEHYQLCNCGEKFDVSEHNFTEWKISKEATETTDGMKKRTCETCGKIEAEKFTLNGEAITSSPTESTPAESIPTDDANVDVGDVSSFPIVPVLVGGGAVLVIAIVVIVLVSKNKK